MTANNNIYAAIDLGSNSFHMLVVQDIAGTPRIIAKVKRKVRLASGLNSEHHLNLAAMERGWQCLALFAERLENIPKENINIVATATLRLASNAAQFCEKAQQILGLSINIISGEQEAALIYHGMAVTSQGCDKRLIIDIGGASTELILGQGFEPLVLNSLNIGCVTWLERYFSDDLLNQQNFDRAINEAAQVISGVKSQYTAHQWQLSLGASGSIQAVQEVLTAQGFNEEITLEKLNIVLAQTMACGSQSALVLVGLKEERKLVFASGLAILITLFKQLNISSMVTSGGALREGLIDQLLGQSLPSDVRLGCCEKLQQRFNLDLLQATQVADVAEYYVSQLAISDLTKQDISLLRFSAMLHEIGTSLSFLQSNRHGRYILDNTPMIGFSTQQRKLVAMLVGSYKNKLELDTFDSQKWCSKEVAKVLACCLRLAVIVVGRHQVERKACVNIEADSDGLTIKLSDQANQFPLLIAELVEETQLNPLITLA